MATPPHGRGFFQDLSGSYSIHLVDVRLPQLSNNFGEIWKVAGQNF